MTLTVHEMPTSLSGEMFDYATRFSVLSPEYVLRESGFRRVAKTALLVLVVGPTFLIYTVAVSLLCAPLGFVYHMGQAIRWKWNAVVIDQSARSHALAWEHGKAACIDLVTIGLALINYFRMMWTINGKAGWWFSSSQVRLPANGPLVPSMGEAHTLNINPPSLHWGTTPHATPQSCPYDKLRQSAADIQREKHRSLPLDDPEVIRATCVKVFKEAHQSSHLWSHVWPQRASFLSHSYTFVPGTNSPDYKTHFQWKFVAFVVATVALLALTAYLGFVSGMAIAQIAKTPTLLAPKLIWYAALCGVAISGVGAVFTYHRALKIWTEMRGRAEEELAHKLMHTLVPNTEEGRKKLRANMQEAFYWLHRAANRGYVPVQKKFGLSLLMALPKPIDTTNYEELAIAREGVTWLQAGGVNGSWEDQTTVREILPISWERICQGIQGNSPTERLASMLEPLDREFVLFHFEQLMFPAREQRATEVIDANKATAGRKLLRAWTLRRQNLLTRAITNCLIEPRQRKVAETIVEVTPLLPPIAKLASEWVV